MNFEKIFAQKNKKKEVFLIKKIFSNFKMFLILQIILMVINHQMLIKKNYSPHILAQPSFIKHILIVGSIPPLMFIS